MTCVYSSMIYDLCILETLVIVVSFSCVYSSMIYDLCILETLVIVVSFSVINHRTIDTRERDNNDKGL
jgi:hypothetical protein